MRVGHVEEDTQYFRNLSRSKDSIAVLVLTDLKIIGD